MTSTADRGRESPARTANFLSIVFFSWLYPLIKKGYKKELEVDDLYNVTEDNSSEHLCNKLEREWKKEVAKSHGQRKKPSYLWTLLRCFKWEIVFTGMFALSEEAVRIGQPLLLARLLGYFRTSSDGITTLEACMYAMGLALTSAVAAFMHHPLYFYSFLTGMRMKVASCAIIYRKSLRLSHRSLAETTTGHIVNLMSTDVARLEYSLIFIHYLWLAPIEATLVLAIMWMHIGPASMSGYALVLILTPVQGLLGKVYARLRMKIALQSDERIRLMDQVVAGMKVIKMYCWEKPFAELIAEVRAREMRVTGVGARIRLLSMELGYFTFSKFAMAACIIAYVLAYGRVPPLETILVVMRLLGIVQDSLAFNMTRGVSIWGEMASTCVRIQEFLLLDEIVDQQSQLPCNREDVKAELTAFSGKWEGGSGALVLQEVNAHAAAGELLAVVGPVGGGKSSLLMALLGELSPTSGKVTVRGRVAYASQQPWIFSASLKQNILFGAQFDTDKYDAVVEACALTKDIESLMHGDETLVGERGVILSGGQRARVGLARAVYQDADIYLLDDPLSAVDAAVARHLFDRCINGMLKDRARVLVTHQLHFLQVATRVLVLVGGQAQALGSYQELAGLVDFADLLKQEATTAGAGDVAASHSHSHRLLHPPPPLRSLSASAAEAAVRSSMPDLFGRTIVHQSAAELTACDLVVESAGTIGRSAPKLANGDGDCVKHQLEVSDQNPLLAKTFAAEGVTAAAAAENKVEQEPEHTEKGTVAMRTYWMYFRSGGNVCTLLLSACLLAIGQASFMAIDWYTVTWAAMEDTFQSVQVSYSSSLLADGSPPLYNVSSLLLAAVSEVNISSPFETAVSAADDGKSAYSHETRTIMVYIYSGLVAGLIAISGLRTLVFYQICMKASRKIHNVMFSTVVRTPMRFFDTNPVGRILNRFSKDIGTVDDQLPLNLFDFFTCFMLVAGSVMMAAIVNPWVLLPLVPIVVVLYFIRRLYMRSSRAIKRLEGTTRSPMFSHLSSTLSGLHTVRAYRAQTAFVEEFDRNQDGHTEAYYLFLCLTRWLAIRLDWMCVVFVTIVTFLCVVTKDNLNLSPDLFGLTITYTMALLGLFQWMVRQSTEIESMMTSVERIAEYTRLPSEAPLVTSVRPSADWPQTGSLEATDASLRYAPDEPLVLKNVSFHINGAEKVGICGRTGAGKSSLLSMLFRLCEPSGRILVDGVPITDIGLHDLRSKLSIIPQDPVLFSTSVRGNLDPFSQHSDASLWDALQQVELCAAVQELPGGLDAPIAEGGANFSVGQRQLLCLARAVLRKNKILVVDEATANVDPRTDAAIQQTIRDKFRDCTVLTIAHRLDTIMDSDRVMVLEAGSISEFDEPHILLQRTGSVFGSLVEHTGKGYDRLCAMAKAAHERRLTTPALPN